MAPRFTPPGFGPRQYPDVPRTLDAVFEAYQAQQQLGQQNRIQGLQLASQGIDPAAAGIAPPGGADTVWGEAVRGLLERKKKGTASAEAQAGAELEKTRAEAAASNAKAAGGLDFVTPAQAAFALAPENTARQKQIEDGFRTHFGDRVPKGIIGPMGSSQRAAEAAAQPTAGAFVARGFADKARQANEALEAITASGFNPAAGVGVMAQFLPNFLKDEDRQAFEQTERQFVNAILRRESGAAIPPSEMTNYRAQYFPAPGDGPAVLAQKARARTLAVANLEGEGKKAPSGLPPDSPAAPAAPAAGGAGSALPIALTGDKAARLAELRSRAAGAQAPRRVK